MLYPHPAGRASRAAATLAALLLLVSAALPAVASHTPLHGPGSFPQPVPGSQVGDAVLFSASLFFDGAVRPCLWRTDGTSVGTFPLPGCLSAPLVARVGSRVVFVDVEDGEYTLWATDGTAPGTVALGSLPSYVVFDGRDTAVSPSGDRVVFDVFDPATGLEPWLTDGTPEGTGLLADAVPGSAGSNPFGYAFLDDGRLVFAGAASVDGGPTAIWRSDLTAAGTLPSTVLDGQARILGKPLFAAAEAVVFWLPAGAGDLHELWRTDGTAPGTWMLGEFTPPDGNLFSLAPTRVGDHVYFEADDGVHGTEVWRTDGTDLERMTAIEAEGPLAHPQLLPVPFGDGGVAVVLAGPEGRELWRLGGDEGVAEPATAPLVDLCPGPCAGVLSEVLLPAAAGGVYLGATDGASGGEPWFSDGTAEGTHQLGDLCPGACGSLPSFLVDLDGPVLFVADDGTHGPELWRATADAAPLRLTDFAPVSWWPGWEGARVGDGFLFPANDGVHGLEPWVSDGTVAGTHLVADLAVGSVTPPPVPPEPPAAPEGMRLSSNPEGAVVLAWESVAEVDEYVVEARTAADGDWQPFGTSASNSIAFFSLPTVPHLFRVRARNAAGLSQPSGVVAVTPRNPGSAGGTCNADADTLCLGGGRFRVEVGWRNQHAGPGDPQHGEGQVVPGQGTDRAGYFWFFRDDNVELVVKVLDGTPINGFYWTFYGALTDVEYWVTVTDVDSGDNRTYYNPPGEVCGEGDTRSLPFFVPEPLIATAVSVPPSAATPSAATPTPDRVTAPAHPLPAPCVEDAETLCLLDGRFRVRVAWQDQHNGGSGVGGALPYSDRTGFFWFFDEENVELVVKVLDGRPINGRIWVFYGALSDVGYQIEVLDTADGHLVREYVNPPGEICGEADTAAF
ncbi:MAG TPA: hypothetical protein VKU40_13575 [Thermoanaerobaculia bacterium]|nr:hypothetical protein [Thermoanaerobaculia bacterium]